jgi:hypothetical protein
VYFIFLILNEISKYNLSNVKTLQYKKNIYTLYYDNGFSVRDDASKLWYSDACYYIKKNDKLYFKKIEAFFYDEKTFLVTRNDSLFLNLNGPNHSSFLVHLDTSFSFCEVKGVKDEKYRIEAVNNWGKFWSKFWFFFQDYEMLWFVKIREAFRGGEIFTKRYWSQ